MLKVPRSASRIAIALPRVIFLTGKGGTGKSTLAKALALALARRHQVTLVTIGTRQRTLSGSSSKADHAFSFIEKNLTPRGELEAFIESIVPVKVIARRMLQSRTFGFVTTALPGLEAFLTLDRLRRMALEAQPNEIIVVDGPATGGAIEMLSVAESVGAIAPIGTLHRRAGEVELFLHEPGLFGVILTVRPEELATREALDAAETLHAYGIDTVCAVLNGVTEALFSAADIVQLKSVREHRELAQERRAQAQAATDIERRLRRSGLRIVTTPAVYRSRLVHADLEKLADALESGLSE